MITVVGTKGAPGATTTALLLAALWPGGGLVVEADPDGGDLALQLPGPDGQVLPSAPGLAQLAVDLAGLDKERIEACALATAAGVPVVCAMPLAASMRQTIARHGKALADALAPMGSVIVDAGRLVPDTPAVPLLTSAEAVVLVVADRVESFFHARDMFTSLLGVLGSAPDPRPALLTVVVASPRRGPSAERELAAALAQRGLPVASAGWLAHDPKALARWLVGEPAARRSVLLRTARPVIDAVAAAATTWGNPDLESDPRSPDVGSAADVAGSR